MTLFEKILLAALGGGLVIGVITLVAMGYLLVKADKEQREVL